MKIKGGPVGVLNPTPYGPNPSEKWGLSCDREGCGEHPCVLSKAVCADPCEFLMVGVHNYFLHFEFDFQVPVVIHLLHSKSTLAILSISSSV